MMSFALVWCVLLLCSVPTLGQKHVMRGPAAHCINESRHTKDAPSRETEAFAACELWQDNSCCTAATTRRINSTGYRDLYNFNWNLCGQLSEECAGFMEVKLSSIVL